MGLRLPNHSMILLCLIPLLLSDPPSAAAAAAAQGNSNITPGTTFSPLGRLSSWTSPSGDFAFGFRATPSDTTLFLLAVWFTNVPEKTIIWFANGDNPVRNGSTAEVTATGHLSLKDQTGQEVWTAGGGIAATAILDTGNLVLIGPNSSVLWQSFDHPTDTILPTQVLNIDTQLNSRLLDTDFSNGRFQLVLQNNGNLSFYYVAVPTAHRYDSYGSSDTSGSGIQLVFNETGTIYLSDQNGTNLYTLTSINIIAGRYYQRATLDPDGIFRHYVFFQEGGSGSWEVKATAASDVCNTVLTAWGSGACGFNSYCQLDAGGRVDCQCAPHYSFIDPVRKYKGCTPEFPAQSCVTGGEAMYGFVNVSNIDWPLCDFEQLSPMNESECRESCLKDCFCNVAVYQTNTCWKKKSPLSNGRTGSGVSRVALIKYSNLSNSVQNDEPGSREEEKKKFRHTWILAGSLLLGCSLFVNFAQAGACLYSSGKRRLRRQDDAIVESALRAFTYKELEGATRVFKEQVGRGAFGTVYKGVLAGTGTGTATAIAVKKLESYQQEAEKDFMNEVRSIGQTHHKNLVRLYGFCKEGTHRLLVYEFMSNGSLNGFLFGTDPPEWRQRVQIAVGIARGLAYLHEECRTQIIHCDIKPQNILLDDDLVARISDFGLAKLLGIQQTRTSTGVRGTIGYFAPEWFKKVAITAKVDVYSFGVMLLEIICCRRNVDWKLGDESSVEFVTLADWAKQCYCTGRLELLADGDDKAKMDTERLERFVLVAMSCMEEEPWMRPSMRKVVLMLEGEVPVPVPPNSCH